MSNGFGRNYPKGKPPVRKSGVDFGTSPHGLSAGRCQAVQETRETSPLSPPAKPLLTFSFTEAQRAALSFAAQCEAEDLAEGHEANEPEVLEAIRHLWEARSILEGRPA